MNRRILVYIAWPMFLLWLRILSVLFLAGSFAFAKDVHSDFYATSSEPHVLKIYAHGPSALKEYLSLLSSAKTSIDLESFVLITDDVGSLILQTAKEKALQGIHVRLLLDAYGSKKYLMPAQLDDLQNAGIEIRFYNATKFHPLPIDHRKFLIIDGMTVFFGGRNLSEENFGVSSEKHRLDYSAELQGPLAKDLLHTYNVYWNSSMVTAVENKKAPRSFVLPSVQTLKAKLEKMPMQMVGEFHPSQLVFVSDEPSNNRRLFADFLAGQISLVQQSLRIETPSFAVGKKLSSALQSLLTQKKMVSLLTVENTDHSATLSYSVLGLGANTDSDDLKKEGAFVSFKSEALSPEVLPLFDSVGARGGWGSHCKATIFDGKHVLLGSFNYDILSEEHNSEAGIYFLNSPDLAKALLKLEASRPYQKQ